MVNLAVFSHGNNEFGWIKRLTKVGPVQWEAEPLKGGVLPRASVKDCGADPS